MRARNRLIAGSVAALTGLAVLLAGFLMPPYLLETGQIDPRAWLLPGLAGAGGIVIVARWLGWRAGSVVVAMLGNIIPPVLFCALASAGSGGRFACWWEGSADILPLASRRPALGVLSGPILRGPPTFAPAPLWQALSRPFDARPLDAVDAPSLAGLDALLLVQPRALAPEELVVLDSWVRMGGRAVLLVDLDLRWADSRPIGHPQRPPPATLLGPLLAHWGVTISRPNIAVQHGGPVQRWRLDDGRMIQVAGTSQLFPAAPECAIESRGMVARCRIGRGAGIIVADADLANDALWTKKPETPLEITGWTSDAVPFLADLLGPGAGEGAGRRVWLGQAGGVPVALRFSFAALLVFALLAALFNSPARTKQELIRPVPG
ncbi:hypothetical protein BH10PSE13_BH10PSE13_19400 [soil metagenome]